MMYCLRMPVSRCMRFGSCFKRANSFVSKLIVACKDDTNTEIRFSGSIVYFVEHLFQNLIKSVTI